MNNQVAVTTGSEKTILPGGHFGNFESKLSEIEKKLAMLDDLPGNSEILQRGQAKER